jgi:hypothetical protein
MAAMASVADALTIPPVTVTVACLGVRLFSGRALQATLSTLPASEQVAWDARWRCLLGTELSG